MSLLKVNEVQNYNGSSLTLTASTVSTSAQLNTGGNVSVTGSINVSDDSTTRSNLGLGSIATQDSDNVTLTGGTATLGALTVSGSDSGDLVRITQTGSGNALVVEDSANPDSTPFVVDASGKVGIGTSSPNSALTVKGNVAGSPNIGDAVQFGGSGGYASIEMSGSTGGLIDFNAGDGTDFKGRIFYDINYDVLDFQVNSALRMRIDNSGNLGLANSSNIARIKAQNSISLADDGSINVTTACGASIVCAYDQTSGEGIACFVTYASDAQIIGNSSNTANSDTDNKLCIFKSTNSHTTTVKNRLGTTRNFSMSVIGATSD